MAVCETCGNSYDRTFTVTIGHGVEADGVVHCSADCAGGAGVEGLCDRIDDAVPVMAWRRG